MGHLVQPSCRSRVTYSRLHRTLSRRVLNISREARTTSGNTGLACRFAAVWNCSKVSLTISNLNTKVNQLWRWPSPPASHLPSRNSSACQELWQRPRKKMEILLAEFTTERGSPQPRWALSPLEAFCCCCCFKRKLHILGRLWSYYQTVTTRRHKQKIIVGFKHEGSVDLLRSFKELWLSETSRNFSKSKAPIGLRHLPKFRSSWEGGRIPHKYHLAQVR